MSDVLEKIMTVAASGMSAQSERLNLIASNLANVGSVGTSDDKTFRARYPVFSEVVDSVAGLDAEDQPIGGVRVTDIKTSDKPLDRRYEPENPLADSEGYIHMTDVNPIQQMTDMISASKEYEANIQVINTSRSLLLHAMDVIKD